MSEFCPICENSKLIFFTEVKDYTVSHETFTILHCQECDLGITAFPTKKKIENYYESQNYISHTSKFNNLTNGIYLLARKYTLRKKLKLINNLPTTGKTLLDVGCGTGEFLHLIKRNNWKVNGIELSNKPREKAENLINQKLLTTIEEINEPYNLITLWHVLEHIANPNQAIQKLTSHLEKKGLILIAVPNFKSKDANHYKSFWAAYDVPRHLWHFSKKSMELFLSKNNLTIKKIIPMTLDAYYISILSEHYKNKRGNFFSNYIQGILNGLKANLQAKRNGEYSSLIYIAGR